MSTFTPSSTSAGLAGGLFWILLWMLGYEMDTLLALFGISPQRERVFLWIVRHKTLALACTEAFNYGLHGITNPLSVMFALGGTVVNFLMIFVALPCSLWSFADIKNLFRKNKGLKVVA